MKQIDLFDFSNGPSQRLLENSNVFIVNRADINESLVKGTYLYGAYHERRGYWLTNSTINDEDIEVNAFQNYADALSKSNEYIQKNATNILLASTIETFVIKRKWHFSYIRNIDSQIMHEYYVLFENGMVYIKNYYSFAHILNFSSLDEAEKWIKKQIRGKRKIKPEEYEFKNPNKIIFKNMYRCSKESDWDYAENGYSKLLGG